MARAIAAAASLALAVKLKRLFEAEDRFLTFPTGLGYSSEYLEFMGDPYKTTLSAQEQLNFKADFSRQMNLIPQDKPAFMPDAGSFLWNELEHILNASIFAQSALTESEEGQLSEAIDFLTDDHIDDAGNAIPVNSARVTEYYRYKTLCEEAERSYLDEQWSIEFDDNLKEKWEAYREKHLKNAWDKAMQDWINLGSKRQTEQYQALKNSLELKKYLNLYRQNYLNELSISELHDLNGRGIGFYTSFFSPADAFDKNLPWTSITVTKPEIVGLIKEAPPALKNIFGVADENVDIENITLEYNNVIVIRPWFKSEFFKSRYWKLPDETIVSSGQAPCKGRLPAYITSMIVARNVRICRRKEAAQVPVVLPLVSAVPVQKLKLSATPVLVPERLARPALSVRARRMARARTPRPPAPRTRAMPRTSFTNMNLAFALRRPATAGKSDKARRAAQIQTKHLYATAKFKGLSIKTLPHRQVLPDNIRKADLRLPPKNSSLVTEHINFDGVSVLALVCKRVPKSPDPDLSLLW